LKIKNFEKKFLQIKCIPIMKLKISKIKNINVLFLQLFFQLK